MLVDNIVVGKLLVSEEALGILPSETTVRVEKTNPPPFLPKLLVKLGLSSSSNEVRKIDRQRQHLIKKDPRLSLWRALDGYECTPFKVGKRHFWLFVGD